MWTTYTYDSSGRTLTVTSPDGISVSRYTYQGNQTTQTDAAGKWKTFTSDAMGNLITVTEPDPTLGTDVTNYTQQCGQPASDGDEAAIYGHADAQLPVDRQRHDQRHQPGERDGDLYL